MQVIELKPSNRLQFKIPNNLTTKFTIGNLTLRTVGIYVVPLHPDAISISNKAILIDAFQEAQLTVFLHWSQSVNSSFKSKLRVYIWELYDDELLSTIVSKMFDKQTDGNCLLFEELTIDVDFDEKYLQKAINRIPQSYLISRINLPNQLTVNLTEQMIHKVLNHCEKLGKVKAIYTYGNQYVVQFSQLDEIVCSFCQVRDASDRLAIFGIRTIISIGSTVCSPDILYLSQNKTDNVKLSSNKSIKKQSSAKKSIQQSNIPQNINKIQKPQYERKKQSNVQISNFEQIEAPKTKKQSHANQIKQGIINKNKKDLVKQSFFVAPEKSRGIVRKRTRSQEFIVDSQDCDFSSASIDIEQINSWRNAKDFEIKVPKIFQEKSMDFSKRILNMELSSDQKYIYILLRDCVIICQTNLSSKRVIKFDPIDSQNTHLPTPMIVLNKQRTLIFANQSYLFWVSLTGQENPDWKYVQRKQIYAIQVIEELNLLMVGGKNFSKLAYLGKSTQRSNIKVYSSGKLGKRDHLFTYDLPDCNGQNVISLKYITTKPNGTKLLLTVTHLSKIFFLRVRAYNHIEVYSCIDSNQIGIQEMISLNYFADSGILICLEKLSEDAFCFKYLKINCSYQKVEIGTQSVKLPVAKYLPLFRIGGKIGSQWLTAVDNRNCIYSFYLSQPEPQKTQYNNVIKDCLIFNKGLIFRQPTQIRCRIVKYKQ